MFQLSQVPQYSAAVDTSCLVSHTVQCSSCLVSQYSAAVDTSCLKSLTQYSVHCIKSLSTVLLLIPAVSSLSHSIGLTLKVIYIAY